LLDIKNLGAVTILILIASLSLSVINVVIDAIMVVQSRKDPANGSQNLMTIAWSARGFGGVVGALGGGLLTKHSHPYTSFLLNSIFGLFVALNSAYMPDEVEDDGDFFLDD
jgi:predicted MFS family arabinose efflux permease